MLVFVHTDKGKIRNINEDYHYISKDLTDIQLCILADGMGGYNGGEIASSLATICAKEYIIDNFDKVKKDKEEIQKLIKESMEYANQIVYKRAQKEKDLEQMGTTLEICLIYNNRAYIGHVGDSRIYRIRNDIMRKITTDHSYLEKLIKDGTITKEEAYDHPKKNMLMKALGCGKSVEPDVIVKGFQKDDIIMMCSDGLYNMMSEGEMFNIIKEKFENAAEQLVKRANDLGGYDNISVILIKNN